MHTKNILVCLALLASSVAAVGCSSPVDNTKNQMATSTTDPNYPAGPYGYAQGSVMDDFKFLGKTPTDGNYEALPMRDIYLGEFHEDPGSKLLLIVGAALWCGPCNNEAPNVEAAAEMFGSQGVHVMTVLVEGQARGVASTADDITAWVTAHSFKDTAMGIDPAASLFQFAPASAFPLQIIVDATTMKINSVAVGEQPDLDAQITAALGTN